MKLSPPRSDSLGPALGRDGEQPAARTSLRPASSAGSEASVLVVDDDPWMVSVYAQVLASAGYKVRSCEDGNTALCLYQESLAAQCPYDVVILDQNMPGINGDECARRLSQQNQQVRIIMASGYEQEDVGPMADQVKAFLTKPFRVKELLSTVDQTLRA